MNKHTFVIIIIFLLIAVTSISIPASAQTQESKSKLMLQLSPLIHQISRISSLRYIILQAHTMSNSQKIR